MKLIQVIEALYLLRVGVSAMDDLSTSISNLPECSLKYLKPALEASNCDVGDVNGGLFNCMCQHLEAVGSYIDKRILNEDHNNLCLNDFTNAFGGICGDFDTFGTAVSDWPQASSLFAQDLRVTGSSAAATTGTSLPTSSSAPSITVGADASPTSVSTAGVASSSSDDVAPTTVPHALRVMAGAVAAIAPYIM